MTDKLRTESNLDRPDDFYQALIEMHDGLTPAESLLANAKLILLLANHIGDSDAVREAMAAARKGLPQGGLGTASSPTRESMMDDPRGRR